MTEEETERMLADCIEAKSCRNSTFSKWEQDFVDSIEKQWDDRHRLSVKQQDTLRDIWDKI